MISLWRRFTGLLLSIGEHPEETQEQQGKRRIFVIAATIGCLGTLLFIPDTIDLGQTQVAVAAVLLDVAIVLILFVGLKMRPHWIPWFRLSLRNERDPLCLRWRLELESGFGVAIRRRLPLDRI